MKNLTRRRFVNTSLTSIGALGAARAAARGAVPGANEKIRVGLIGCGGMGRGDILTFLKHKDTACPVICDVDDAQIEKVGKAIEGASGRRPDAVKDFRRVMDRKDVDACVVATPDHWHALPTIHACAAGKDVYVEKPLATSIGEGRAMVEAARKHERVVQMGTQWRSGRHYQEAVAHVHSGKLGKIRQVRCWAYLDWVHDVGKPEDNSPPPGVDYDMWLGPAPKRRFNPARFHFSYRWFWDYGGGLMTDWGVHLINIAHWAMNVDAPQRVSASGGKYTYDDISETPDTQCAMFDYPGFTMIWEHQMTGGHGCENREHGVAFYGTEATLIVDSAGWEVVPEKTRKPKIERHKGNGRPEHVRNFLDCIRSRKRPVQDVEIGHRVTTTAHLGNVALLTKQSVRWNTEKERAVGSDEANRLVTKPYRAPWKLPA